MKKNYSKLFILTVLLFLFFTGAFAQKNKFDTVYLKDGSIVRGSIIEYLVDKHVKIETSDNSIWVFQHDRIDKISFGEIKSIKNNSNIKTGYFNFTDIGVLIGSTNSQYSAPLSIMMVNAYRFKQRISAGIGVGLEFFSTPVIPVFIDARYDFYESNLSPFVYLKAGYSFQTGQDYYYYETSSSKGGPMLGTGVGIRVSLGEKSQFVASLGYRYQNLSYTYYEEWSKDDVDIFEKYNRLAIRVGFVFN